MLKRDKDCNDDSLVQQVDLNKFVQSLPEEAADTLLSDIRLLMELLDRLKEFLAINYVSDEMRSELRLKFEAMFGGVIRNILRYFKSNHPDNSFYVSFSSDFIYGLYFMPNNDSFDFLSEFVSNLVIPQDSKGILGMLRYMYIKEKDLSGSKGEDLFSDMNGGFFAWLKEVKIFHESVLDAHMPEVMCLWMRAYKDRILAGRGFNNILDEKNNEFLSLRRDAFLDPNTVTRVIDFCY